MYTTCVIWLAYVPIVLLNTEKVPLKVSFNVFSNDADQETIEQIQNHD